MASIKTQPVLGDIGSQEVAQLLHSYNHLLDAVGDLITGLRTAANIGAQQTLATAAETALQNNVYKIQSKPPIPLARKFAAK